MKTAEKPVAFKALFAGKAIALQSGRIKAAAPATSKMQELPTATAISTMPTPVNGIKPTAFANLFNKKPAVKTVNNTADALTDAGIAKELLQKTVPHGIKETAATADKASVAKFLSGLTAKKAIDLAAEQVRADNAVLNAPLVNLPVAKQPDFEWDESQLEALAGIEKQQFACLIGAAGTGKTTVERELVNRLKTYVPTIDLNAARLSVAAETKADYNVAIAFAAFTGRAVQQMKRALPEVYHPMCSTIHSLLGYAPTMEVRFDEKTKQYKEVRIFRPSFGLSRKLPYKIILIDEAGMVPINLWNELINAITPDVRIILIGDINQLPPVQGRSVLGFAMSAWPTFELTKIHRQAQDNPIIMNAHNILNGRAVAATPKRVDIVKIPSGSIETFNLVNAGIKKLTQAGEFDPFRDAIIVPQNIGNIGQVAFNQTLIHFFNPPKSINGVVVNPRTTIKTGITDVFYAVGDKVMVLQNDNQLGLTNGMIGTVIAININGMYKGNIQTIDHSMLDHENFSLSDIADIAMADGDKEEKESQSQRQATHVMTVAFDNGREVPVSTAGDYRRYTHSYAITCHKSQGGEYHTVIIVLHTANAKMLSREWLYTAFTRASERVIVFMTDRALLHSLNTQKVKGRTLKDKIASFVALQDKSDVSVPNLPEAAEV